MNKQNLSVDQAIIKETQISIQIKIMNRVLKFGVIKITKKLKQVLKISKNCVERKTLYITNIDLLKGSLNCIHDKQKSN